MSEFGDGTFKQALLEAVKDRSYEYEKPTIEVVRALAEVLAHLAGTAEFEAKEAIEATTLSARTPPA